MTYISYLFHLKKMILIWDWGLGIGDWGLGIGPNPQSPIPNPESPIPNPHILFNIYFKFKANYLKLEYFK